MMYGWCKQQFPASLLFFLSNFVVFFSCRAPFIEEGMSAMDDFQAAYLRGLNCLYARRYEDALLYFLSPACVGTGKSCITHYASALAYDALGDKGKAESQIILACAAFERECLAHYECNQALWNEAFSSSARRYGKAGGLAELCMEVGIFFDGNPYFDESVCLDKYGRRMQMKYVAKMFNLPAMADFFKKHDSLRLSWAVLAGNFFPWPREHLDAFPALQGVYIFPAARYG